MKLSALFPRKGIPPRSEWVPVAPTPTPPALRSEALASAVACRDERETDAQTLARAERFTRFIETGEVGEAPAKPHVLRPTGGDAA